MTPPTLPRSAPLRCDRTEAWAALRGHYEAHGRDFDLRDAFARDPARFESFGIEAPEIYADLSKNRLDTATLHFLVDLARECGVEERRAAMFAGAPINATEDRAVLHSALRAPRGAAPFGDEVHRTLDALLAYAETVRDSATSGIRHVVNIGIGGSDLGPQMAVPALDAYTHPGLTFETKWNVRPGWVYASRAGTAICGPRSLPPMPMLTMWRIPLVALSRTVSA